MTQLPITLATRDYAYVQPLAMGDVRPDGIDLTLIRSWDALPRVAANSGLDGGEASFARYVLGLAPGERSVVGLPIFLMRGFRQRCFFVHRDSPLREIADLGGKRVGINEWPATGNTWARALLRDQGVPIDSVFWLVGEVAEGYKPVPDDKLPVGVEYAPRSRLLVDMLIVGEIDALVCPWPPAVFNSPNSPVRRLYPDFPTVEKAYFRRTGIYPGHHIVVLRRDLVEAHPEVVGALYTAFDEARRAAEKNLRAIAEILPWLLFELEEDPAVRSGAPAVWSGR